jgi:YidC/Oxa1 family membrane protein insertase
MIGELYKTVLYEPLLNLLIFLYDTIAVQDLGLAIIFVTILIRILLFPLFQKSARHQAVMQRLQPKLKKVQEDHKHDKERQAQAMMAVYREHDINPFSGFGLLLIQLPVLITLYHIFQDSLQPGFLVGLYAFVQTPQSIEPYLLGLIHLGRPSILMVGLAALAQYFQAHLALPPTEKGKELSNAEKTARKMVFIAPIITLVFFYALPAAISLYWLVASFFSVIQQIFINRQLAHGTVGTVHTTTH